MSLTIKQKADTRVELEENLRRSGRTLRQVAEDLDTSQEYVEKLMRLEGKSHNHTWILRNYLYEKVLEAGKTPVEFTALKGSCRDYWFLDAGYIERGVIGND